MRYRFNTEKAEELISISGLKKKHIIMQLRTSTTTFGRWMKEETPIPLVVAGELADIINCDVRDLLIKVDE